MENWKHKTTALGGLMVLGGIVKSFSPELVTFLTAAPDVLVMVGAGLIFGRDAIAKIR